MKTSTPTINDLVIDEPAPALSAKAIRIIEQAGGHVNERRHNAVVRLPLWTARQGTVRRISLVAGETTNVYIPPGSRDDRGVTVHVNGRPYHIDIQLMPEPGIILRDGDLHSEIVLPDIDCRLGCFAYVQAGPGAKTRFRVQPGTRDGTMYRLPGLGMPDPYDLERFGDFCVLVRTESRYGTFPAPATPHAPPGSGANRPSEPEKLETRRGSLMSLLFDRVKEFTERFVKE